jgi:lysosomal alpha-glucosidase
MWAFGWN